ncbi:MAG: AMP-binding protein [Candidatus Eremiobacteraeota bacterium]|nr:AMP-binding protein [Candidatus Eremiobacteraeota bacterium]
MTKTVHVDTFARDHLPPKGAWPEMDFTLPELHYHKRVNCAHRLLDRHIKEGHGDRRCILAPGVQWSYADLQRKANQIARVLVEDLGIVAGNRVLLRAPNSPMLAACWFAVIKAGAIAVTTMPLYRSGELQYMIEKARVRHALCDARLSNELREAIGDDDSFRVMYFNGDSGESLERRMESKDAAFENADTSAEEVALIGFTSGTTGKPKAAMHFHRDVLAICDSYATHVLQANAHDVFCGSPPLGFTFGLGGLLLFPLHAGAATILLERAGPQQLLDAIEHYRCTVVFTAPIAYRAMTELVPDYDVSSLRKCVSAGETLPLPTWEGWHERCGIKIMDGIGSTEMLHIFIGSPEDRIVAGSTGQAVPGYVAQIHDDDGNPLPPNTVGRLAVKGPTGCRYLDDDRQATYVQNGWNYPGDAYRMDERGYFWYVARTDDMIISAGYNISGPEVEQALLAHTQVKECAVVGKPDAQHGTHIVKAYVVLSEMVADEDAKSLELIEFVKARIAPYKAPREIEFVAALPRTETGKVQRFRLREKAATEKASTAP